MACSQGPRGSPSDLALSEEMNHTQQLFYAFHSNQRFDLHLIEHVWVMRLRSAVVVALVSACLRCAVSLPLCFFDSASVSPVCA